MTKDDKPVPVFKNKTKIPQTVYDQYFDSQSPITLQPGDMVKSEHFRKYAGTNGCLELVSKKTQNIYTKKSGKKKARLEKAKELADRRTGRLLGSILESLNEGDPGWNLRPTEQDKIFLFSNQNDKLFLNLEIGEIERSLFLTHIGTRGLKILFEEVKKKTGAGNFMNQRKEV